MTELQKYRTLEEKTLPKDFKLWGSLSSWENIISDYTDFGDVVSYDIQDDYGFFLTHDHNRITVVVLAALPGAEVKAVFRCMAAIKKMVKESGVALFTTVARHATAWPLLQGMEKKGKIKLINHFTEDMGEKVEVVLGQFL